MWLSNHFYGLLFILKLQIELQALYENALPMNTTSVSSKPTIFTSLKNYWKSDLLSGFLVSLIALPLCLGIAGASNFPPIMGVLTAVVGGLVVSLFAGSELTIKGPAAGLIVICAGAVEELGKGDLVVGWHLTLAVVVVAGVLQVILGKLKVARLADFFPLSAVHGMLAAIGIIIMSKQLHLAVGILPAELKGKEPIELLEMVPHSFMHMEWHIAAIGGVSLLILFGWKFIGKGFLAKVPPALVVLIVAIIMGQYFHLTDAAYQARKPLVNPGDFTLNLNVDFAAMSNPELLPIFLKYLLMFTLIGSLESLLTGRAIDLLDPYKKKSDLSKDLSAVGVGNIVSGLLGGLPMISEVARSSANISNGGRSRWANFFHGAFLLLFVVALVPLIKMVPVAALAAMLIFVGFRLASPKEFEHVFHVGREQLIIFLATIFATLFTDLLIGIAVGIIVKFIIHSFNGVPASSFFKPFLTMHVDEETQVYNIEVEKSAIFSNFLGFKKQLERIPAGKHIIINFEKTRLVDHSVMENLHNFENEYVRGGGTFVIIGLDGHTPLSKHSLASRKKAAVKTN
jgi:MFS superfamily sulfate permease-like transporter